MITAHKVVTITSLSSAFNALRDQVATNPINSKHAPRDWADRRRWVKGGVMPRKFLVALFFMCALIGFSQNADRLESGIGSISGTVIDVNGAIVPGAAVVLRCESPCNAESIVASDTGGFEFSALTLGTRYEIGVSAKGFKEWASAPVVLTAEQRTILLTDVKLPMAEAAASITVYASSEEIATEQMRIEEQQRVLGIIPNFYAVYDSKNAVPLSTRLKFKLAMRTALDPATVAGVGLLSGVQQAAGTPNYAEGARGYGQRFGANAATGFSDILLAGAVLPSLLRQDPRYFYQGTGGTSSRLKHALFSPFITRGDNGRTQINFSSLGGDLASSALAETYYPESNRGPRLVFGSFAIGTAERMVSAVVQEFVLRKFTPTAKRQSYEVIK
jgi:hypothetical protein